MKRNSDKIFFGWLGISILAVLIYLIDNMFKLNMLPVNYKVYITFWWVPLYFVYLTSLMSNRFSNWLWK